MQALKFGSGVVVISMAALLSGCASNVQTETLFPVGQQLTAPPTVQGVLPGLSEARLTAGDQLAAIDGAPVASYAELISRSGKPNTFTFSKPTGEKYDVSASKIMDDKGQWEFSLFRPYDGLITTAPFIDKPEPAAMTATEFGSALVSMQRFKGAPNLIEVQVTFLAAKACTKCTLKSFGIVDTNHNSLLTPIPINQAAWMEYPDQGQPGQFTAVPPPTPLGSTTTTVGSATFNGTCQQFGSFGAINGNITGMSSSVTNYNYDYSAQNAANMYNLGVAIRNASIQAQNAARTKFINSRFGNLRLGALNPGETVTGHMFFAAPAGFDGPYAFVVLGDDRPSAIVFTAANNQAKSTGH